jgi:hypothetical protein
MRLIASQVSARMALNRLVQHRLPRLFADLAIAHGDDRYARLMRSLSRVKLLILDDWGPEAPTAAQARDLLEIVEDRYDKGALIITSQVPVDRWHDLIGGSHARRRHPRSCHSQRLEVIRKLLLSVPRRAGLLAQEGIARAGPIRPTTLHTIRTAGCAKPSALIYLTARGAERIAVQNVAERVLQHVPNVPLPGHDARHRFTVGRDREVAVPAMAAQSIHVLGLADDLLAAAELPDLG